MSKIRFHLSASVAIFILAAAIAVQASSLPGMSLAGTVRSSGGKSLEGVAVSARANEKTFTTSVYTGRNGEYFFPTLDGGQYTVWAHAVGFETGGAKLDISAGK